MAAARPPKPLPITTAVAGRPVARKGVGAAATAVTMVIPVLSRKGRSHGGIARRAVANGPDGGSCGQRARLAAGVKDDRGHHLGGLLVREMA